MNFKIVLSSSFGTRKKSTVSSAIPFLVNILFTTVSSQGPNEVPVQGLLYTTKSQAIAAWHATFFFFVFLYRTLYLKS